MKSVLISIQPKWVKKIASGQKTIEVRKTRPKIDTPFKCYIYETKGKKVECGFHFEETGRTLRERIVYGMREARIVKHYCNEGQGKVIGEFVCDNIYPIKNQYSGFFIANATQGETNEIARQSCLDYDDMVSYLRNKDGYGWHISDIVIYDKPKELSKLECEERLVRPPQSWCYVEELKEKQK